jgi:hypothetical protein
MKTKVIALKLTGIFFLAGICLTATAQKLPNVQPAGILAPADIKIDGKTTEWNDKFQAYNRATDIYYTLSNDDDHLYLTVQATIPDIINKIIGGGITLTIQKSGRKNDKDGISITYPIFTRDNRPSLGINRKISVDNGVTKTESSQDALTDSVIAVRNKQLADKSKYIGVIGIPGVDSLISVYNENGIKTGQAINNKGAYTCELSINLKTLSIAANDASKFAYHITLNGMGKPVMNIKIQNADGTTVTNSSAAQSPEVSDMIAKMTAAMNSGGLFSSTDFWGEYTLAKKQ